MEGEFSHSISAASFSVPSSLQASLLGFVSSFQKNDTKPSREACNKGGTLKDAADMEWLNSPSELSPPQPPHPKQVLEYNSNCECERTTKKVWIYGGSNFNNKRTEGTSMVNLKGASGDPGASEVEDDDDGDGGTNDDGDDGGDGDNGSDGDDGSDGDNGDGDDQRSHNEDVDEHEWLYWEIKMKEGIRKVLTLHDIFLAKEKVQCNS